MHVCFMAYYCTSQAKTIKNIHFHVISITGLATNGGMKTALKCCVYLKLNLAISQAL